MRTAAMRADASSRTARATAATTAASSGTEAMLMGGVVNRPRSATTTVPVPRSRIVQLALKAQ